MSASGCGLIGLQKIAGENCEESIRTILRIAEPGNAARRWDINDAARARKEGSEAFRISSAFDGICLPTDHMVADCLAGKRQHRETSSPMS